ncbi:MAG: DUF2235 domain-containing protein, partial [Nitrospinota bacterium]|nr:DUF2235 domain-containing protein [Nitrospinota bacterium]
TPPAARTGRCGILKRKYAEKVDEAFDLYQEKAATPTVQKFASAHSHKDQSGELVKDIHFISAWDTVGSVGLPDFVKKWANFSLRKIGFKRRIISFHDTKLSEKVSFAYHAISIDDKRKSFYPRLWDERQKQDQVIEQVWFPGVYSNVEGGYVLQGLSDITLRWMLLRAVKHDLKVSPEIWGSISPDENSKLYDSRGRYIAIEERNILNMWGEVSAQKVKVHVSARDRMNNPDNNYHPQNLPGSYDVVSDDG